MQGGIHPHMYPFHWQSLVATSGGPTYHWTQDTAYLHAPQVDAHPISLSPYGQGFWTGYPEGQPPSAFPLAGHKSVPPDSIQGTTYVNVADMATTHNNSESPWTDHMSTSAFSDQGGTQATPNLSVSSTPTLPSSTVVGHGGAPSAHSDEELFECPYPKCGKLFEVKSSVRRHFRKNHDSKPCLFLFSRSSPRCDFKYGGPYDYGRHLKAHHNMGSKVIKYILGKAGTDRGRATIIGRDRPLPSLLSLYTV